MKQPFGLELHTYTIHKWEKAVLPLVGLQCLCLQLQVFVEETQHDQGIRVSLDPLWVNDTKSQPTAAVNPQRNNDPQGDVPICSTAVITLLLNDS